MNDMKPVKEGWPLWVWLKGVRATSSAPSKIERLLSGGTSNLLGRGAAFFSGRTTVLTEKAQRKVNALERQIDKLGDNSDDE